MVRQVALSGTSRILHFHQQQIARRGKPGQFVEILTVPGLDPFLRRPMSIFSTDPAKGTFAILFAVVGPGTRWLDQLTTGAELSIIGPFGNTFSLPRGCRHAVLVAGGVGLPPLDFWARRLATAQRKTPLQLTMLIGARCAAARLRVPRIKSVRRHWSTDDGSSGFHGNVVELLDQISRQKKWEPKHATIYGCGPAPMLRALQNWMIEHQFHGQLSLEEMMACGFGVCSGCVVRSNPEQEGYDRFKRVCYDGPVFDSREVLL
jgi:dihydroorotate dehydrogenase electron transfer subunit